MNKVVIVTGASSGFGRLAANAVARSGHTVYASMRETSGRNAPQVAELQRVSKDNKIDLRAIELDVQSQESVDRAVAKIISTHGHIDVVVHKAGHMDFGPAEAFTPQVVLRHICPRTSLPRREWTRSPSATLASWPCGESKPQSSCREHSLVGRTISHMRADLQTRLGLLSTTPARMATMQTRS
jgi:hypothetical protein